ncbi:MAG TPA: hypothetical protein VGD58_15405 [Herpetosiphonaceae bacterium]
MCSFMPLVRTVLPRSIVFLWLVVCATVAVHAGQAAHDMVPVVTDETPPLEPGSPAFWHAYLQVYHWGMRAGVAVAVGLVSVAGVVLHAQGRTTALADQRRTVWLGVWTSVLLLCGGTAWQGLTTASTLAGTGQLTAAFWQAYLQFHQWAVLASLVVLVGLLVVSVRFRRAVTIGPLCCASVAILFALSSLDWLTQAQQVGPAQAALDSPAFWHPYLWFHLWGLIAYVVTLVGVLWASVALQRVVSLWPIGCTSLALAFSIAAWNGLYETCLSSSIDGPLCNAWFWEDYTRFHASATLSSFALLVSLGGAGAALLYANGGWLLAGPRQPTAARSVLPTAYRPLLPPRPVGVTVLGGWFLLNSILGMLSLLASPSPQIVLAFPISLSLGLGFLGQRRWSWEGGLIYFGIIPPVAVWTLLLVGASVEPWSLGFSLVGFLIFGYLWSVRQVFVE